jgi:uncharacterized membrane protein
MELSEEERRNIYEEEKARIESEEKTAGSKSTIKLEPKLAGLICYVGFWVTGIIFLIIEKKNKTLRFHAMQSLVVFGILNIIWGIPWSIANSIDRPLWPIPGGDYFFTQLVISAIGIAATIVWAIFFIIWWVYWGVLMYQAYHNKRYKVGLFKLGDLAEKLISKLDASD